MYYDDFRINQGSDHPLIATIKQARKDLGLTTKIFCGWCDAIWKDCKEKNIDVCDNARDVSEMIQAQGKQLHEVVEKNKDLTCNLKE